jgi:glycerol-3-phosphate dehydrogenase
VPTTSAAAGTKSVAPLDGRHFDAVIVGGGINGAGVARDAALRGLAVCLFEKGDYAGGTSSKSTKIAHGGLRYLKHYEFGLVFESQQERHILGRLLPHLIWPQSFCYPVYKGDPDPLWLVRLGVGVYDALAAFRNVERHHHLSPAQALAANPGLRHEGLRGAVRYWDDRMDDARIVLENVLSAEEAGATCLNYREVLDIKREGGGYRIRYRDAIAGGEGSVTAAAVVNCGGPWGEEVAARAGAVRPTPLAPTKGVHVVVPRLPLEDALILSAGADGRVFFVIPWAGRSLIGTTDTKYAGDPDNVEVTADDVDYLLEAARHYLPGQTLSREGISYAFAGLRPLVAPHRPDVAAGAISRRHHIFFEPPAFITLLGGKFTTYRRMAEETVDRLLSALGRPSVPSPTRKARFFRETYPKTTVMTDRLDLYRHLQSFYGPRAGHAFDCVTGQPRFTLPVLESSPVLLGQLAYALEHERAHGLGDLLYRRTHLAWQPDLSSIAAHRLLDELAPYFGDRLAQARAEADALAEPPSWNENAAKDRPPVRTAERGSGA